MALPIFLATLAPTIAKAIGSRFEKMAIDKVKDLIDKTDEESVIKIKQAEEEFKETLAIITLDIADARNREVQVKDYTPRILAYGVSLGFFGILALYTYGTVPEVNASVLNILLGSLGTAWVSIINYYFGSSIGSQRKTELLSKPE